MRTLLSTLLLLLLTGMAAPTLAQPCDPERDSAVAALTAELDSLKTRTSAWEKVLAALPKISGYVQTGYEWSDDASTFFIKRVRLNLSGSLAKRLDYRVQIEFCSPKIVDAYLRYRPFDNLSLQLGEYKLPFSIENTEYVPLKYEFIEYPLSLRRLMGFSDLCGLSATGRDMGAMLSGSFFERDGYSILNCNVGVFNGEGLNIRDLNRSKDLVARVTLKPFAGFQIAASGYWGTYGEASLERTRYGLGACYDRGPVVLRYEYICGTTGFLETSDTPTDPTDPSAPSAPAGTRSRNLDSEGWYAVGGWRVTRNLLAVARYDTFLEERSARMTRQTNWTAGLLWQPVKCLRCQLNYTYEEYASPLVADRNVVALMLSGIF